jgi:hypothetical protein
MNQSFAAPPPNLIDKVTSMCDLVSQGVISVVFHVLNLEPNVSASISIILIGFG